MKKSITNVAIIGAIPAGLFASLELVNHGIKDIFIFDKSPSIKDRTPKDTMCGAAATGIIAASGIINYSS